MAMNQLVIITTVFNNLEDLELTAASVTHQTEAADRWLFLDSSDRRAASVVKKKAIAVGADYLWCPPEGVYAAMNRGLINIPKESWVWFINASDWLGTPQAIARTKKALRTVDKSWLVGSLIRREKGLADTIRRFESGPALITALRDGKAGFPHPATVMRTRETLDLAGFDESFAIAADFNLALQFAKVYGPPAEASGLLVVQEAGGLSSRHFFINLMERFQVLRNHGESKALRKTFGWALIRTALRFVKRVAYLLQATRAYETTALKKWLEMHSLGHFCEEPDSAWPECCRHFLAKDSGAGEG
jgi:glycosyltransferase involved in cell wall biosynthesis